MTRVLVIKLAAIGDVVMAMPLLPALRKKYPEGRISWVCGAQAAPLLRATGLVDELIEIDERKLLSGSLLAKVAALLGVWSKIAGRPFDLVLTVHTDPRYRLLTWPVFCRDKRSWQRGIHPVPGRYHAQECLRLLDREEGAIVRKLEFPSLQLPPYQEVKRPLIVLAPGGAKNVLADDAVRRWPIEHYAKVASALAKEACVIITGSASDEWVRPYFPMDVQCMLGNLTLLDLVALLQKSSLLITHDSGPLHLAKLARCAAIALFGPTIPQEKVGVDENIKILWGGEHLACRPCYTGKMYTRCQRNKCLRSISAEQVIAEAKKLLSFEKKERQDHSFNDEKYDRAKL